MRAPDEEGGRQVRPRSCLPLVVWPSQKKYGVGSDEKSTHMRSEFQCVELGLEWVSALSC